MLDGFRTVLPNGGDIVISQEAATYRPEMEWIAARLNQKKPGNAPARNSTVAAGVDRGSHGTTTSAGVNDPVYNWRVVAAENYEPRGGRAVSFLRIIRPAKYSRIENTLRQCRRSHHDPPPIKPYLEEKMWFALFGCSRCANLATRTGRQIFRQTQEVIPYSWLLIQPLPQHAVIRAGDTRWREAVRFSQKDRDLLLRK
jgi:hypothetical protein